MLRGKNVFMILTVVYVILSRNQAQSVLLSEGSSLSHAFGSISTCVYLP